ncbi:MAG: hypothetical protein ABIQ02_14075, partial [Saprospiraceae bacterium]
MNSDNEELNKPERKKTRGIAFWLGRLLLIVLTLFLTIMILIEIPFIQMWGAGKISRTISRNLKTTVSIGGFSLNPISDLTLTDVLIGSPDFPGDTLINVSNLQVDFKNLWDLFSNRLTINQIVLQDGLLNIERKEGDSISNLDRAMLRMFPSRDTTSKPFVLDLDKMSATNLNVKFDDNSIGTKITMFFHRADVEVDSMDMVHKFMNIGDLDFDQPVIYFTSKPVKVALHSKPKPESLPWSFDIDAINLSDGKIYIDNQNKQRDTINKNGLDYAYLMLDDVDVHMDSLQLHGSHVKARNLDMHVLHHNGFELERFSMTAFDISSNGIDLRDLVLKTKNSLIQNSFNLSYSEYSDFKDFADSVRINIPAADIRLQINDLLTLVPMLNKVTFFKDNQDKSIVLQGNINGNVNRLKILNINAGIGGLSLTGDFRSRDLARKGSQLLSLDLDRSTFSARSLKDLFPGLTLPPLMSKLGQISFAGKFDGYPDDFVAFGTFYTSLGAMKLDMNLN